MLGGNEDTDRRNLDTGGSLAVSDFMESDSTGDCHAMRKSFQSPTLFFHLDPKEFIEVLLTTAGSAVLTQ